MNGPTLLLIAAVLDFALALLHVAMLPFGSRAYAYFGAGEAMVRGAQAGSLAPHLITLGVAFVLVTFGLYALSGAGMLSPWPLLRYVLAGVSGIYLLRGLAVLPQLITLMRGSSRIQPRHVGFSLVSLIVGIIHAIGTQAVWPYLP